TYTYALVMYAGLITSALRYLSCPVVPAISVRLSVQKVAVVLEYEDARVVNRVRSRRCCAQCEVDSLRVGQRSRRIFGSVRADRISVRLATRNPYYWKDVSVAAAVARDDAAVAPEFYLEVDGKLRRSRSVAKGH